MAWVRGYGHVLSFCASTLSPCKFVLKFILHHFPISPALQRFYTHPDLECALRNFHRELALYNYPPGTGLRPTLDKLIAPWAGIETSWTQEPGSLRLLCNETNPGNLFLSPAPGEEFDLTIQLVDLLLGYVTSTVYLEVEHEVNEPPGVLIQLNGIQYSYSDRYDRNTCSQIVLYS